MTLSLSNIYIGCIHISMTQLPDPVNMISLILLIIIHPTSQNGGSNIWYRNVSIVFQIDFHHVSIHQQLLYDYSGMDIISRGWDSCASHVYVYPTVPQHVEYQMWYTVTSTIVLPPSNNRINCIQTLIRHTPLTLKHDISRMMRLFYTKYTQHTKIGGGIPPIQ